MSTECYPEKAQNVDALLDTLSHQLRREILHYFENCAERVTATLDTVVAHIERRVPSQTEETVAIQLVHTHLPKLEARGWLDYDPRGETIRYHGHGHADQWLGEVRDVFTA